MDLSILQDDDGAGTHVKGHPRGSARCGFQSHLPAPSSGAERALAASATCHLGRITAQIEHQFPGLWNITLLPSWEDSGMI